MSILTQEGGIMFGRIVSIDGLEIFVCCTPQTPYSEICRRAAEQLAKDEEIEAKRKAA